MVIVFEYVPPKRNRLWKQEKRNRPSLDSLSHKKGDWPLRWEVFSCREQKLDSKKRHSLLGMTFTYPDSEIADAS